MHILILHGSLYQNQQLYSLGVFLQACPGFVKNMSNLVIFNTRLVILLTLTSSNGHFGRFYYWKWIPWHDLCKCRGITIRN